MGLLDRLLGTKEELDEREEPVTKIDRLMMKHEGKKGDGQK